MTAIDETQTTKVRTPLQEACHELRERSKNADQLANYLARDLGYALMKSPTGDHADAIKRLAVARAVADEAQECFLVTQHLNRNGEY